jgi:hypothetical protein
MSQNNFTFRSLKEYKEQHPDKLYFIQSEERADHFLIHHKKYKEQMVYSLSYLPKDPVICSQSEGEAFIKEFQSGEKLKLTRIEDVVE